MEQKMITLDQVSKTFSSAQGTVAALDNVSLELPASGILGIVGDNASGKSTIAKVVTGQERPDHGVVRLEGTSVNDLGGTAVRAIRRHISSIVPVNTLGTARTVAGNVATPLEQAGVDGPTRRAKVTQLLDLVGLSDQAGQTLDNVTASARRRVAIARSLVFDPAVLVADEPTDGIDQIADAGVLASLDRVRAELGTAVLLLTKDVTAVRKLADSVALLDGGSIRESGYVLDLATQDSALAQQLLPQVVVRPEHRLRFDTVAEVVLVGYAAVGNLLPEAGARFNTTFTTIGGGITRFGDTPVARFAVGANGTQVADALTYLRHSGVAVRELSVARKSSLALAA
jgi:D-methionine transport system ATP-binding protein